MTGSIDKIEELDLEQYKIGYFTVGSDRLYEARGKQIRRNGQDAYIEYIRDVTEHDRASKQVEVQQKG
ncbi:MAG: hypothetical protein Q4B70_03345 [Lachnospiraceae bacterium]|nr:hypothetical protein [Lachnospiraceae bacterium]